MPSAAAVHVITLPPAHWTVPDPATSQVTQILRPGTCLVGLVRIELTTSALSVKGQTQIPPVLGTSFVHAVRQLQSEDFRP
jgi:hypothetical protein